MEKGGMLIIIKYKKVGFLTKSNLTELIFKNYNYLLKSSILVMHGIIKKNFKNFSPIKLEKIKFRNLLKTYT